MKKQKMVVAATAAALLFSAAYLPAVGVISDNNISIAASATATLDRGSCGENVYWELKDNGTLYITGSGNMQDHDYMQRSAWMNDNR